ncbi:hypothetical protein GCM10020358_19550 [Amorphoplanes nipponensis]|uniref:Uncharacterized protein n=1 Tax=Actinoplanes nipponensis TaxID=135950 RepID=A0A919JAL7_9ACTN|nr:hypothetical protein [Actinoplanes nipponensis]GIE46796.1 hypothetical protein Ani05nite_03300 [Actinoplanes nipponensis]
MPVWLLELMETSPYVAVPVVAIWLIVKHWCLLLAGTFAVLHPDERRREDAREVVRLLRYGDRGPAALEEGPPPGRPPRRRHRRRRRV